MKQPSKPNPKPRRNPVPRGPSEQATVHLPGLEITDPLRFAGAIADLLDKRARPTKWAGEYAVMKVGDVFFGVDVAAPRIYGPFTTLPGLYRSLADGEVTPLPEGDLYTLDDMPFAIAHDGRVLGPHWDLNEFAGEAAEATVLSYDYESDGMAGGCGWRVVTVLGAFFIYNWWDGWTVHPGPYPTFEAALDAAGEDGRVVNPDGNAVISSSLWGSDEIEAHFTRWYPKPRPGVPAVVVVNGEERVWGVGT